MISSLAASSPASAETATLAPAADTTLFETNPNNNLGATPTFVSGSTRQGEQSRALLKFDVAAALPSNAVISAVQLVLDVAKTPFTAPVSSVFNLHRFLVPWIEGAQDGNTGSEAAAGEPTWNARSFPDMAWSAPGAAAPSDYVTAASGSLLIANIGRYTFPSTAGLVADVQAWLDHPQTNQGWILISTQEAQAFTAKRFSSREANDPNSPRLLITFTTAAPIPVPQIAAARQTGSQFELQFQGDPGFDYVVQFADNLGASWNTLTNFSVKTTATNLVVQEDISLTSHRFYRIGITGRNR